jgi:hypothetical protein
VFRIRNVCVYLCLQPMIKAFFCVKLCRAALFVFTCKTEIVFVLRVPVAQSIWRLPCGLEGPRGWCSSPGIVKIFHLFIPSKPALGPTQPPIQCVPGALSLGVKWLGCEADHSPTTTAEVKKTSIYIHSLARLHGAVLN